MNLFFLHTIIEVLPSKLPTWMWNEESPVNDWLSAMVNYIRHQKITKNHFSPGTCLKIPPIPKRHAGLYIKPESIHPSKKKLFSVKNARKFLRNMKDASGSNCNCLPDCELTDLQHSLATTDFMWVTSNSWHVDKTRCLKWIKQHTESRVSPGHVTRATLTWTLSACWKLVLFPNFGQTGLKLSLS